MTIYLVLRFVKLTAVLGYAGGLVGRFTATEPSLQRRSVHRIASPAMLVVWSSGLALASVSGTSFGELWIVLGLVLSLASLLCLVWSVSRPVHLVRACAGAVVPLLLTVGVMVLRPRWSDVL
ncbi:MAG: hypothetical protein AB7S26_05690 [Sandaracinaceae bacterium]